MFDGTKGVIGDRLGLIFGMNITYSAFTSLTGSVFPGSMSMQRLQLVPPTMTVFHKVTPPRVECTQLNVTTAFAFQGNDVQSCTADNLLQ